MTHVGKGHVMLHHSIERSDELPLSHNVDKANYNYCAFRLASLIVINELRLWLAD